MITQEKHNFNRMSDLKAFIEEQKAKFGREGIEEKEIKESDFESLFGDLQSKAKKYNIDYNSLLLEEEKAQAGLSSTSGDIHDPRTPLTVARRALSFQGTLNSEIEGIKENLKTEAKALTSEFGKLLSGTDRMDKIKQAVDFVNTSVFDPDLKDQLLNCSTQRVVELNMKIKNKEKRESDLNLPPVSEDINNENNGKISIDPIAGLDDLSTPKDVKREPPAEIIIDGQSQEGSNNTAADLAEEKKNVSLSLPGGDGTVTETEQNKEEPKEPERGIENEGRPDFLEINKNPQVNPGINPEIDFSFGSKKASIEQTQDTTPNSKKVGDIPVGTPDDGLTVDTIEESKAENIETETTGVEIPAQEGQQIVKPENKNVNPVKMVTFDKFGNMIGGQTETTLPPKIEETAKPVTEPVSNTFKMPEKDPVENRNITAPKPVNLEERLQAFREAVKPKDDNITADQVVEPKKAGNLDHLDNDGILRSAQNDSLEANFQNDIKPIITEQPVVPAIETKPVQSEKNIEVKPEVAEQLNGNVTSNKAVIPVDSTLRSSDLIAQTRRAEAGILDPEIPGLPSQAAPLNPRMTGAGVKVPRKKTLESILGGFVQKLAKLPNTNITSANIAEVERQKKTLMEAENNENK